MITYLREKLDKKDISCLELTDIYLKRIKEKNKKLNCFITICDEYAKIQAKQAQKRIDKNVSDILTGIPVSIKDNIMTKDIKTTCASKMLKDFLPTFNATVTEQIENDGAVILGKNNMDEFAMGNTSQNSYFGGVKNPYDLNRVPGGSSGGGAASVSSDLCVGALGSDTGGSVRQPASFCGVTAIKPTYGTISRHGLIAFSSSLDQIGVISKSAEDCAILLNSISGHDPKDMTSVKRTKSNFMSLIGEDISKYKVGICDEFFDIISDDEVKKAVYDSIKFYEKHGAKLVNVDLPSMSYGVSAYYLISSAEAASNLSRYDGIKYGIRIDDNNDYKEMLCDSRNNGLGEEVKRRILLGNYALSENNYSNYYEKALKIRSKIISEYDEIFTKCDFLITPTATTTAPLISKENSDPQNAYLSDICTVSVNLAGLPAINTTCGYNKNGLPIGMSIIGTHYDEAKIINAAYCFEKEFGRKEPLI